MTLHLLYRYIGQPAGDGNQFVSSEKTRISTFCPCGTLCTVKA
jgi:hypothetical protein